jgi:hypothetical protein
VKCIRNSCRSFFVRFFGSAFRLFLSCDFESARVPWSIELSQTDGIVSKFYVSHCATVRSYFGEIFPSFAFFLCISQMHFLSFCSVFLDDFVRNMFLNFSFVFNLGTLGLRR